MSERYNLPADTAALLNDHINKCKNLALILDKYPTQAVVAETKNKGPWLQNLIKSDHIDTTLTQSAYDRWRAMMSAMKATLFNASLDWRMVIGLGGETVLETDLTLHHLYGIPFIPGSALKGLTRAYVTGEIEGYKSDKIENDNEEVKRIFGTQKSAGTVLFFDTMPLNGEVKFVVDIMNPHYPDYYNSLKSNKTIPPTNDQSPNPITFLTVTDSTFTFALAPRNPNNTKHKEDVETVKGWLQGALQKYGVGGKTSAGYGYFNVVKDEPKHESKDELRLETVPAAKPPSPPPPERKLVGLPPFRVNQEIMGVVATEAQRNSLLQRVPTESSGVFLIYRDSANRDYSLDDVVILVSTAEYPETQDWIARQQRKCQITQIEKRGDSTVLMSKPVRSRFADKKKR